jgi:protein involved in polysaccharide export with SLBB domain
MNRKIGWFLLFCVLGSGYICPQTAPKDDAIIPNTQLALSTPDYQVTAGDIYLLSYMAGTTAVEYPIIVDSTYRIRISNLGIINTAGKTFNQLKNQVEAVVSNNYPLGGVQFVLTEPATFRVYLKGEVQSTKEISAWALTRLSTIVGNNPTIDDNSAAGTASTRGTNSAAGTTSTRGTNSAVGTTSTRGTNSAVGTASTRGTNSATGTTSTVGTNQTVDTNLTDYSSIRNVTVKSSNGQVKVYDLFKAERFGDLSQNPYVRPDDVITINRLERRITLNGAVKRPGTYQLLAEENLKDLIDVYGDGFTPLADSSRIELVRFVESASKSGDKITLTQKDVTNNFQLQHFDDISVPDITALQPVIFIEGAVGDTETDTANPESSNRFTVTFIRGEYYSALIRSNRQWFTAVSDTRNAYLIRGSEHIPMNLNPMLYDENFQGDMQIEENDLLIIPFRQYFVNVAGAVVTPGRYPYIPDRTWDYYIALAGGFISEKNRRDSVDIVDISGRKLGKTDVITPETIITAKTNSFLYYFNQYAPAVTTVLSIVSTFITIYFAINR